jgi:hypothetical protein
LRENSRLKSLKLQRLIANQLLAIASALRENKGLVKLDLNSVMMSDKTWDAICDSLGTHPTLEVLGLFCVMRSSIDPPLPAILSRIQALVKMLKVSTTIHTIRASCVSQHETYRESVIPYLETNRLRPRLLAIQTTRPIAYRTKVLGRALLATRTDANSFWMLLSGNVEVAFPTSATAAVTDTTTLATSATGASAVDIVVAPTSGQKRKPRP